MKNKKSAGILLYRYTNNIIEFLLVHPAEGPYFKPGDNGWWSIPKGEFEDEQPLEAALREFEEEIGTKLPDYSAYLELTPVLQKNGKTVYGFAIEKDIDVTNFISNTFTLEVPIGSGIFGEYPEIDKAEWFDTKTALIKLGTQRKFINELIQILKNE